MVGRNRRLGRIVKILRFGPVQTLLDNDIFRNLGDAGMAFIKVKFGIEGLVLIRVVSP